MQANSWFNLRVQQYTWCSGCSKEKKISEQLHLYFTHHSSLTHSSWTCQCLTLCEKKICQTKGSLRTVKLELDVWGIFVFFLALFLCTNPLTSNSNQGLSWPSSYGSWIYNYLCNQCLSPLTLWGRIPPSRGVLDATLCDKVCQWPVLDLRHMRPCAS